MKMAETVILVTVSILIVGCASKWVKVDNSAADSSQVNEAKAKCQIDDKLYRLSYQEIATKAAIQSISDEASKEELREGFRMKEQKVYDEINACMKAEGLKPKS